MSLDDVLIVGIGFLVGVGVGISGVGGGSLMTPLLILALRVHPLVAIGTDLLSSIPTKLVGAFVHGRQGTVDRTIVLWLCAGGIPGALAGLVLLGVARRALDLETLTVYARHGVAIAIVLSALAIVVGPLLRRSQAGSTLPVARPRVPHVAFIGIGAIVGLLVSLTSIGSGSVTLPALLVLGPHLGLRRLVGSDVTFAAFLLPIAALGHWSLGDVDLHLAALITAGSVPGVIIGGRLCARLPDIALRPVLAGTLVLVASRLL